MRKFFSGLVLLLFLISNSAYAIEDDAAKKLEAGGKKIKDLIEKYEKASTTKWNEVTATAKDTDGNPRDCTLRVYYNDYKQDKFSTSGGSFTGQFDHGKTLPSKVLSVAVEDCPCRLIKMDQRGPIYPQISEEIEKAKIVLESEIKGAITDKLTEEAKAVVEKGLAKFFEGLGYGGTAMAKRFLGAVSVGAEIGAPIGDFITKTIDEIFDAVREEARINHELTNDDTPLRNNVNIIKPRSNIRNLFGLTKPESFTKYELDLLLRCPQGAKEPKHLTWKPAKWIKPITAVPDPPKPPIQTEDTPESDEDYAERIRKWNEQVERENKERAEAAARQEVENARIEAERKAEAQAQAQAEAAAQAKAERITKECKKCNKLKQALDTKRAEYEQAWEDLGAATKNARESRKDVDKAKKDQTRAEAARDNFNKPGTDYVESNGRRIDATDLELRNAAAALGWERYQAGDLSASELSDYWSTLDGDAVDTLRAKVKADLKAEAAAAKAATEKAEQAQKDQEAKVKQAQENLNKKSDEVNNLENAHKDCLKKCQADQKVNILQDYGVTLTPNISPVKQWFPWNWGEEIIFETTIDPLVINTVPDYSTINYDLISATPKADKKPKPLANFHSVLNEINTQPLLINQHQLGSNNRLVNISTTPNPDTGGLGLALQILIGSNQPDSPGGAESGSLSDIPEVTKVSPGSDGVSPSSSFVLTFSEPMNTASVEDNFIIRSFSEEALILDESSDETFNPTTGFGGDIWDKNQFDINWNSDDTQATFTFDKERAAQPPKKKTILIIIIIDRRAQQAGLVGGPPDFFALPNGALNDGFSDTPPIFSDGFESGDISAWNTDGSGVGDFEFSVGYDGKPESDLGFMPGPGSGETDNGLERDSSRGDGRSVTDYDGFLIDDDLSDMIPEFDPNPKDPKPKDDFLPEDPNEENDDDLLPGEEPIVCPAGEYRSTDNQETDTCSAQCGGNDSHCVATTPGCGRCVSNCPTGEYSTQSTCSIACVDGSKCVPSGNTSFYGQGCWSCLVVPIEFESKCLKRGDYETNNCGNFCGSNQTCEASEDGCFSCQNKPQPVCGNGVKEAGEACDDGNTNNNDTCSNTCVVKEIIAECPESSFAKSSCSSCDGGCEVVPNIDNLACYKCKEPEIPACIPECSGKQCGSDGCGGICGQCDSGQSCDSAGQCENDAPTCSAGSTPNIEQCNSQCSNGACNDDGGGGCYTCLQCDTGSFSSQSACESDGSSCAVGGSQGNLSCWVPQLSCEDRCTQNGFSAEPIDFTSQVESQLNAQTCVSSYSMQIQQARVGDCTCYVTDPPSITFDTTPPVCADTVCGDVSCGQSASCATGENQTTTVTCNWGGWQKQDLYQYIPLLGGN